MVCFTVADEGRYIDHERLAGQDESAETVRGAGEGLVIESDVVVERERRPSRRVQRSIDYP